MADVELVIKISDYLYEDIKNSNTIFREDERSCYEAVQNGTPLPKGHGRLIDVNSVYQIVRPIEPSDAEWGMTAETAIRLIHDAFEKAPTIIKADKESEE